MSLSRRPRDILWLVLDLTVPVRWGWGMGGGFALVRNSYANVGMENVSIGGKSKTSFTILGFCVGTQIGKILVAADM